MLGTVLLAQKLTRFHWGFGLCFGSALFFWDRGLGRRILWSICRALVGDKYLSWFCISIELTTKYRAVLTLTESLPSHYVDFQFSTSQPSYDSMHRSIRYSRYCLRLPVIPSRICGL